MVRWFRDFLQLSKIITSVLSHQNNSILKSKISAVLLVPLRTLLGYSLCLTSEDVKSWQARIYKLISQHSKFVNNFFRTAMHHLLYNLS